MNSPLIGDYIDHGSQQYVFADPNNHNQVIKVFTDRAFTTPEEIKAFHPQWFKRNQLQLQMPIKFRGYLQGNRRIYPVYSQNRVTPLGDVNPYVWRT